MGKTIDTMITIGALISLCLIGTVVGKVLLTPVHPIPNPDADFFRSLKRGAVVVEDRRLYVLEAQAVENGALDLVFSQQGVSRTGTLYANGSTWTVQLPATCKDCHL